MILNSHDNIIKGRKLLFALHLIFWFFWFGIWILAQTYFYIRLIQLGSDFFKYFICRSLMHLPFSGLFSIFKIRLKGRNELWRHLYAMSRVWWRREQQCWFSKSWNDQLSGMRWHFLCSVQGNFFFNHLAHEKNQDQYHEKIIFFQIKRTWANRFKYLNSYSPGRCLRDFMNDDHHNNNHHNDNDHHNNNQHRHCDQSKNLIDI